jgi:Tfp pilus assembly protein FimT
MELLVVVGIVMIIAAAALPSISTTISNMHLSSTASSLAGGLQSARYLAISTGCPVQITVSAQTYKAAAPTVSGTPPACSTTYPYPVYPTGGNPIIQYASSDVSCTTPQTVQFNPNGTVSAATAPGTTPTQTTFSFPLAQLSGTAIKTVNVSGIGYVSIQ